MSPAETEEIIADLAALVLAGRPDRVVEGQLALLSEPERARARQWLGDIHESLAALAVGLEPEQPSGGVRERILETAERNATPSRRALLVIDMINDHLRPGGPVEVPRAREIVPAVKQRIEAARAEGQPVVYVVDEHEPDDEDLDTWGAHAIRGTSGAEVCSELSPRDGDVVVKKRTYSGFSHSTLEEVLDDLGVDTLVLTGCLTELGMLATATAALERGYEVSIPEDSQAGASPDSERAALGILNMMAPYGSARRGLLERLAARREDAHAT